MYIHIKISMISQNQLIFQTNFSDGLSYKTKIQEPITVLKKQLSSYVVLKSLVVFKCLVIKIALFTVAIFKKGE